MAPQALAAFVRAETLRLVQYLATLRAMPRDGPPVQVLVIAPAAQRASFEQALVSDVRLVFRTVDIDEAAQKVGIKRLPADAAGEQLFLHLAVRNAPKEQFARGEDRRSYFLWRLQRAIVFTGVAGFAACLLYAGARVYDLFGEKNQISALRQEAQAATQQYERKTATFPVTQTTTDNLKATVVEFTKIAGQSASPEPALAYLSQIVEKFPQMEIESVQWRVGKPEGRDAAAEAPGAAAKPGRRAGSGRRFRARHDADDRGIGTRQCHAAIGLPRHHRTGAAVRPGAAQRSLLAHPAHACCRSTSPRKARCRATSA